MFDSCTLILIRPSGCRPSCLSASSRSVQHKDVVCQKHTVEDLFERSESRFMNLKRLMKRCDMQQGSDKRDIAIHRKAEAHETLRLTGRQRHIKHRASHACMQIHIKALCFKRRHRCEKQCTDNYQKYMRCRD